MLVESQTEQGSILSIVWSWLYAIVSSAPVNHYHKVNEESSPPVTVNGPNFSLAHGPTSHQQVGTKEKWIDFTVQVLSLFLLLFSTPANES